MKYVNKHGKRANKAGFLNTVCLITGHFYFSHKSVRRCDTDLW